MRRTCDLEQAFEAVGMVGVVNVNDAVENLW